MRAGLEQRVAARAAAVRARIKALPRMEHVTVECG